MGLARPFPARTAAPLGQVGRCRPRIGVRRVPSPTAAAERLSASRRTGPLGLDLSPRPQGHGYTIVHVDKENPYFEVGMELKGHEFHYSRVLKWQGSDDDLVFTMKRGSGVVNQRDGILYKNVLATYTHLHALGTPIWAKALVRNAVARKSIKK